MRVGLHNLVLRDAGVMLSGEVTGNHQDAALRERAGTTALLPLDAGLGVNDDIVVAQPTTVLHSALTTHSHTSRLRSQKA